jgi:hypothetical protein
MSITGKCKKMQSTEDLSPKQDQFMAALLAGNSIIVAAKAVGIAERTAHNWLKLPHFQEAYKAAKQAVFDHALEGLQDDVTQAIDTLKRNMTAEDPSVQVRAAHLYLTHSLKVHKMDATEAILKELEEIKGKRT